MKKTLLVISMCMMLSLTACGADKNNETPENGSTASQITTETNETQEETAEKTETPEPTDITAETQTLTAESFELTDKGSAFLLTMCRDLIDFDSQTEKDETFWCDFLFSYFTGPTSAGFETVQVYFEKYGHDVPVIKVSLQDAETVSKLIFGIELPDIKPTHEDMAEDKTSLFYQDGYYYIAPSDPPDLLYTLTDCEESDGYVTLKYKIDGEGYYNWGAITFTIVPEDNENGFIITSKKTDIFI